MIADHDEAPIGLDDEQDGTVWGHMKLFQDCGTPNQRVIIRLSSKIITRILDASELLKTNPYRGQFATRPLGTW